MKSHFAFALIFAGNLATSGAKSPPNIVLVMADDQGWGQTGYYNHPVLKTPHLDAMAAAGLRFDRFYAGGPVCSPTRASVLTGRSHERTGVPSHGYALRKQEKTLPAALAAAGYSTSHFGKWHLNGLRGPGVPILKDDSHHPGELGFDRWISVTNYFDRDPIMSRDGNFEEFAGDSSEIIVDQTLAFIRKQHEAGKPSFSVIWYGTPHSPFVASDEDRAPFAKLDAKSANHYGELVAMDRSIGTLRKTLRELEIADNTLVWFCSDNGGLPGITPPTVGGLRGFKGSLYEGGLRVPAIIEWPAAIKPRVTAHPACVMDIFPTLAEIVGLPDSALLQPQDGLSLQPLFKKEIRYRSKAIPFRYNGGIALIDNDFKLIKAKPKGDFQLFNLADDPSESKDISGEQAVAAKKLRSEAERWSASVDDSIAGKDYPEGQVDADQPERRFWRDTKEYRPFFDAWRDRPEYQSWLNRKSRRK